MKRWNGLSLLRENLWSTPADHQIQTDASGTWGCRASFQSEWFQWQWPQNILHISIMAKELIPITLNCAVLGSRLSKCTVLFQCNNLSLVSTIAKGYSRDKWVMRLLRCMWFFVAYFYLSLHVKHIAGVNNTTADQLSRN